MNNEIRFGILNNETGDISQNWINACNKYGQSYVTIDLVANDWLQQIKEKKPSHFLLCPPGLQSHYKTLYDERIYIISKASKRFVYPAYEELILHENKKFLSYFLEASNIPHPKTYIFYRKSEVLEFSQKCEFPIVAKMNIGASGSGVKIIKTKSALIDYINQVFSEGIRSDYGPNLKIGGYGKRILNILKNPSHLVDRIKKYKAVYSDSQKGFLLLQKYIPHNFEWRAVKIGNSYFGHQKVKMGEKASGSKGIDYILPPESLLNFIKSVCLSYNFNSIAIDCFEDGNGGFLVNEMQTVFGHVQDHICENNGTPGRLKYQNDKWEFEAGNFNTNLSYDLRFENVLEILNVKR